MAFKPTREEIEINIPVPWGHVAGKAWNNPNGLRVLFVHGWLDNAGSFDALIPLLPESYYCIVIDLPGHGKSSHYPKGLPMRVIDYILTVERVVDFLGWDKFTYIGHSLGGQVGFFFCSFFNDRVDKMVVLDAFVPGSNAENCVDALLRPYLSLKETEDRVDFGKPPEYSYKAAIQRLIEGRPDPISEKTAKTLAKRSLIKYGNGYRFSMDQRLKSYERDRLSREQVLELFKRLKCSILHIVADQSMKLHPQAIKFQQVRRELEKRFSDSYRFHIVNGYHSVHMDFPEQVSGLIINFLGNTRCQL